MIKTNIGITIVAEIEAINGLDYDQKKEHLLSELEDVVNRLNHNFVEMTVEYEDDV